MSFFSLVYLSHIHLRCGESEDQRLAVVRKWEGKGIGEDKANEIIYQDH